MKRGTKILLIAAGTLAVGWWVWRRYQASANPHAGGGHKRAPHPTPAPGASTVGEYDQAALPAPGGEVDPQEYPEDEGAEVFNFGDEPDADANGNEGGDGLFGEYD